MTARRRGGAGGQRGRGGVKPFRSWSDRRPDPTSHRLSTPPSLAFLLCCSQVPKGKLNRGLTVVEAMEAIRGESPPEITWRAAALGWCVEWLQV